MPFDGSIQGGSSKKVVSLGEAILVNLEDRESEEKLGEESGLSVTSSTCTLADETLDRVKSKIFCGNSDLLH